LRINEFDGFAQINCRIFFSDTSGRVVSSTRVYTSASWYADLSVKAVPA
jgi:hypothetical protein